MSKHTGGGPRVGLVTYNLAKDWDIETIIEHCTATGFAAVELRTTHAHGVEVSLGKVERGEVKRRFADSPVVPASLGSAFEYHSPDRDELDANIEGTKEYALLARDVGAEGIKVRPNGLQVAAGVPIEKTLEQIGTALRECAAFAKEIGVEVRLEVHGHETSRLPYIRKILDYADEENLSLCWNCNPTDLEDGGLVKNFALVSERIHFVHMRDLSLAEYPWKMLFVLLADCGYTGYCCAEIPESSDPLRVMHYYRALFEAYQP